VWPIVKKPSIAQMANVTALRCTGLRFSIFTKRNRSQAFDWHNNRQAVDQDFDSDSDGKAVVSEGSNGNDLFKDLAGVNV